SESIPSGGTTKRGDEFRSGRACSLKTKERFRMHCLSCPTTKLRHPAGDVRTQWSSRKRCASSGLSVAPGWAVWVSFCLGSFRSELATDSQRDACGHLASSWERLLDCER